MFRIEPEQPAAYFKTYSIRAPLATHWRPASCAEAGCEHYLHGWQTIVAGESVAAEYIRSASGRRFTEERQPGGLTEFTFGPGQDCFQSGSHRVRVQRPEIFTERGGDWRGNPLGQSRQLAAGDWTDSFANHQERVKTARERG